MTLRIRIALACFVIGAVLIGLNFLNLRLTDALRPYLLYAGIGLLVVGFVLAVVRWSRAEPAASGDLERAGDVAVLEPAAPVAPARAEVILLVGGNGASAPSVRWYHVAAATTTHVGASKARLRVAVRGEQVGADRGQWETA